MTSGRILDCFCCAGGAAMGYYRAGFQVVGIDIKPQPHYPFPFIQGDVLDILDRLIAGKKIAADNNFLYTPWDFSAIHASPPCQGYSSHVTSQSSQYVPTLGKDEPKLIKETRERLIKLELPYVIENVMGAKDDLNSTVLLCGSMFGLPIARHRLFETSFMMFAPPHPSCKGIAKRYSELKGWEYRDMSVTGKGRRKGTTDRWKEILGIDWEISQHELSEAIPPAYTKFIGEQLLPRYS